MSRQKTNKYKAIIFDLDDTLIDTYRYRLIPALKNSWSALTKEGLRLSEEEFFQAHREFSRHGSFFKQISLKCPAPQQAQSKAEEAFYGFELTNSVKTFDGVEELLTELRANYRLYLVTTGQPDIQQKKIVLAELGRFFESVEFVDYRTGQNKKMAIEKILQNNSHLPEEILCVGNRLDDEIQAGNSLGLDTCLMQYGEHIHQIPDRATGQPTYTIHRITELKTTCRL